MSTSCIPEISKKICSNPVELAVSAARSAAASAEKATEAAKLAEETAQSVTPYIGANGNWWRGDVDLGYPAQGPQGEQGDQGIQGEQGIPGETPYIGANGNWWIGDKDLGVFSAGSGVSQMALDAAIATRTTILEVTQAEMDQITDKTPNIYIIK